MRSNRLRKGAISAFISKGMEEIKELEGLEDAISIGTALRYRCFL
ncbi:MAG: hypothetical protein U9R75_09855 [Candidatus Thermoplasmatota archaeon]|nr:hypothetical protein [Candidatus Thermoplasmatota archaeon]MEA3559544.1 hypothetical protein [Candidatus Thermoplasmatota archaeon]